MAEEAGEVVSCPQCGQDVKQKAMIPVLGEDGTGHRYLCQACARRLIPEGEAEGAGVEAGSEPEPAPTGGGAEQQD